MLPPLATLISSHTHARSTRRKADEATSTCTRVPNRVFRGGARTRLQRGRADGQVEVGAIAPASLRVRHLVGTTPLARCLAADLVLHMSVKRPNAVIIDLRYCLLSSSSELRASADHLAPFRAFAFNIILRFFSPVLD